MIKIIEKINSIALNLGIVNKLILNILLFFILMYLLWIALAIMFGDYYIDSQLFSIRRHIRITTPVSSY